MQGKGHNKSSVEEREIEGLTQFRDAIKPKRLSNRDKKVFLEMLANDEPNENLKRAYKRHILKSSE